jgi:hypothetical protein
MAKAQASLEFLTTYGWMIMVTVLVAGALTYIGVFSPENNLPQQCQLGFEFSCESYTIRENGTVRVKVVNKLGEPLSANSITCIYPDATTHLETFSAPGNSWASGAAFDFYCSPAAPLGGLEAGEMSQIQVRIGYQKVAGGFIKTIDGQLSTNVVE